MTLPLRVHEYGSPGAPDLVLLHGITDAGTTWPDAVARWEESWHILAVDQRGHGESPAFHDTRLEWMQDVMVADVVRTIENARELSGGRIPVVVGHSLGGRVALAVARRRPELVRALVLEDPALYWTPRTRPDFIAEQEAFLDGFARPGGVRAEMDRMRRESRWTDAEIEMWAECKSQVDRRFIRRLDLGELDAVAVLNAVEVPTLVVVPPDTTLVPSPESITSRRVRYEVIDGAGHCVRRDRPAEYFRIVDEFLTEATTEPRR